MSNAAQGEIDVVLINGDKENPADIHGTVVASTKFGKRELFKKNDKSNFEIAPGQKLPLSRSVLAMPMDDLLVFDGDVWDRDADASPNDEVAKGKVELAPELSSSTKKLVHGKYGQVEIRLTWS